MEPVCRCLTDGQPSCGAAAFEGHLECLRLLRALGHPWEQTAYYAALKGHKDILVWARDSGCPLGASACKGAAGNGHLEILQWLRANGCPWDAETCSYAAQGGNLDVLVWARDHGCPWKKETPLEASFNGSLDCLRYAVANGCPWDPVKCAHGAAMSGNPKLRMWIERELREREPS